nr:MarR family transcriptional regulator [uncultured Actinoplanes sp.]
MTEAPATTTPAHSAFLVLAALADLGEATAAAVASHTDLAYSTVTPKLRAWETSGHAERFRNGANQTLWRLTANGRATTAYSGEPADPAPPRRSHDIESTSSPSTVSTADETPTTTNDDTAGTGTPEPDADENDASRPADHAKPPGETVQSPPIDNAGEPSPGIPEQSDEQTEPAAGSGEDRPDAESGSSAPANASAGNGQPDPQHTPSPGPDLTSEQAPSDRRAAGSLRGAILDILEANPGQQYKVSDLCKLIDRANEQTGAKRASAGAVANAAHKLVEGGRVVLLQEKPATFALSTTDA